MNVRKSVTSNPVLPPKKINLQNFCLSWDNLFNAFEKCSDKPAFLTL